MLHGSGYYIHVVERARAARHDTWSAGYALAHAMQYDRESAQPAPFTCGPETEKLRSMR